MKAFDLSFAAMLTHEMDATFRHEWRILPLLNLISDDDLARDVFIVLHIPLCCLVREFCGLVLFLGLEYHT